MRVIAYLYSDPLLEACPEPASWGWQIDRLYHDRVMEAEARPEWQQLLADCQTKAPDCLVIRRLTDLGNDLKQVADRLAQLECFNIRLVVLEQSCPSEHRPLPSTGIQTEMVRWLQQVQHSQRSQRIRQGHARNRVKALPPPGKAPYGYRRGQNRYLIDRTTAPVVKAFFDHFLLYGSLRGAVRHLSKKYGKNISVSTGQRWLTSPVYRGDLEYGDGAIVPDTHAAILPRDEAAQIDRLLRRNRRMPSRTASAPRSLAGLVVCAACQTPMTVTRVTTAKSTQKRGAGEKSEYLYLRPTACPNQAKCRGISYDAILQATIARICEDLPRAVQGTPLPDLEQVKQGIGQEIAAKQSILNQLPPLVANGVLDQETADLRAYKLRTEIAVLQNKVAQLPPVNLRAIAQTVSLPQFWLDLSEVERRFYFREFIQKIEVHRQQRSWHLTLTFIF